MMLRLIISLVFLTSISIHSLAQFPSDNGRFSIPDNIACAPYGNPITISVPECDGVSLACSIDFDKGDGVANTLAITDGVPLNFQYTTPGTYIIEIQFGTTGGFDQVAITILPNEAPEFNIYTCSGNRVQLDITSSQYADYAIDYQSDNVTDDTSPSGMVTPFFSYPSSATQTISVRPNYTNCTATQKNVTPVGGPFTPPPALITELAVQSDNNIDLTLNMADNFYYQLEQSINSASAWVAQKQLNTEDALQRIGLDPDNNFYCYRISTANICDGNTPVYNGNIICSADLNLAIQNNAMALNWNTSNAGVTSFNLQKSPGASPIVVTAANNSYADSDVNCGTTYSYQLISEYSAGIRSISKSVTGVAISTTKPSLINNTSVQLDGSNASLTWFQNPAFTPQEYTVFRTINNSFTQAGTTTTNTFNDPAFQSDAAICYQIQYSDVCGNVSDRSNPVCPMLLTGTVDAANTVRLSWSPYNGWTTGVMEYFVEKYDQNGQLVETIGRSTTTTHDEFGGEQIYSYRIIAYPADASLGLPPSTSNIITLIKNPNLTHPTAFVPASPIDVNRRFRFFGNPAYVDEYQLKVFNRWGELLFETNNLEEGWDGTFNGQRMPEGTYVFTAKVIDRAGRTFDYAGTVLLLKKG